MKTNPAHVFAASGLQCRWLHVLLGILFSGAPLFGIVDGTVVSTTQFPTVGQVGDSANGFYGTGTLIAPRFVLTSANLVNNQTAGSVIFAQTAGRFKLGGITYNSVHVYPHPSYVGDVSQETEGAFDLAIFELSKDVPSVTPSPLYRQVPLVSIPLTIVGYGLLGTGASGSSNAVPPAGMVTFGHTPIDIVTGTFLKWNFDNVAAPNQESNTAPGDSGGPQFITVSGVKQVASVCSGGRKPDSSFGDVAYNTRVDAAVTWIDAITSGQLPGTVAFGAATFTANEEAGAFGISISRTSTVGAASVQLSTSSVGGSATAGTDYTPITNLTVNFADGVSTPTLPVTVAILNDIIANEANETFKVILSAPVGVNLGTLSTATVRIIDNDPGNETTPPSAPTISAPLANARIGLNPGGTVNITGTAADNKGIALVEIALNGGAFLPATLTSITGTTASYALAVTPITGVNNVQVRSTDTRGNVSTVLGTRSFVITRPLVISTTGTGSVTKGFVPTSYREAGKLITITATPGTGFLFVNWTLTGGVTAADIGVTSMDLELPTLSFIFRDGLQLTANFSPTPYLASTIAGIYNGSIHADPAQPDFLPAGPGPEDGTLPSISTEGSITITVTTVGGFTGKLNLDGGSLPIAGNFDAAGNARFGAQRSYLLSVPRPGKTTLLLALAIDITGPTYGALAGNIIDLNLAVSNITGTRAHWNGTTLIPSTLLRTGNAPGIFNLVIQNGLPSLQPAGLTTDQYPRGFGFGVVTVLKTGAVSVAGTLSEGTPFTVSGSLDQDRVCHLFAPLYNKRGFILGDLVFDVSGTYYDVFITGMRWLRPIMDDQYYPAGWRTGLIIDALGTKFTPAVTGTSALPQITQPATDANGNATLAFDLPPLVPNVLKTVGITGADVVTNLPSDSSFKLMLTRSTGKFSGTFTAGSTKPAFQGIIVSKGTLQGGYGFFKSVAPAVKDYTGQAGSVFLNAQ